MMTVTWETIEAGAEPPARTLPPLTRTNFVRYQGASGDMNPVHHDEPFATAAGYPAPLGVGMFHAGVMFDWATDWLGPCNVRRVKARWKTQVWPGDVLTFAGAVVRKYEEAGERSVDLELLCTTQTGAVACQGWATFVVPDA